MTDRTVVYRIQADVAQAKAQVAALGASVKKSADDMTAATKEGAKFRQGLDSLGGTAGKIGLVAAAGLGAAIVKSANFDAAMSKVSAATGETAANMDKLREAALEAGAQTAFSATEAADGVEQLAKAGVSTTDILNGGLAGALDLAAAGEMEVGAAAEVAAKAMAQFGLAGNQVPHIADLLAAAAGNASGEVSDFGMALSQSGLVANQVGLSLEETTAGLAAFAEAGLLGSDAGTSLKTMLGALTPNSTKAAKAMEALGLSAYDSQGNFIGLAEFAGKLRGSLKDMSDEQRQATMETIFGSDAVRAASVLYEQGEKGIRNWITTVDDQGAAAAMAAERLDNLKGDLEALGGSLETALIGVGDSSQGPLRSLTQGLTAMVNDFGELPSAAHTATAAIMGGSALIGGSVWAGSKVIQGISGTRDAMENLGVSSDKATKAMKGLAAAGAGLAALTVAAVVIRSIQAATDDAIPGVEELTGRLIDLSNLPSGFSGSIGAEFNDLADSIDRMTDKSKMDAFADTMQTPFVGMFGEAGGLRQARADIEALDQALAGMVSSGRADVAADALENLAEQYGLSEAQVSALMPELKAYGEALDGQANDAKLAGGATDDLAAASEGMRQSMEHSTAITEAQAKALKEAREAASETAGGFVNLGDGLDDAKVSLGKWITQMANQADALTNFMNNAKAASKRGLRDGLINDLQDAGTAGALRMKQLANATDEEIARANKAWARGQNAMRDYVNFKVPSKTIDVNNGPALSAIAALEARLRQIKDEDVFVNVRHREYGRNTLGPVDGNARGGFISGPGTATSDSIPAYLSNGEYVVKAAAVDKYGIHMFDRLNAMHFAAGGSTDKDADRKREEARRRAEERRRREEERRQRRLEAQRIKALLASDLQDEAEQAALEVQDARRRLKSAQKADRPKSEIREARLALKEERTDRRALRNSAAEEAAAERNRQAEEAEAERTRVAEEAEEERTRIAEEAEEERVRIAEEAARRQQEIDDAIFAGQQRAWDQATDAAKSQVDAAKAMVDSVQQNMDRIGQAATAQFSGSWFSGGQDQQHGLWTGANIGPAGDWRSKATASISGLQERSALISRLGGLGLSGAALEDLLGNQSNEGIAAMIRGGEIDDFAALFAQRQSLLTATQQLAGQAGFGAEMSAANAHLASMSARLGAIEAAVQAARPITVLETISAQATAAELVRLLGNY